MTADSIGGGGGGGEAAEEHGGEGAGGGGGPHQKHRRRGKGERKRTGEDFFPSRENVVLFCVRFLERPFASGPIQELVAVG